MSFEILEQVTTVFPPLNSVIDADRDYRDNALSACNCGGQPLDGFSDTPLAGLDMKTLMTAGLIAVGVFWLWVSRPDTEKDMELERLRAKLGLPNYG